MGRHGVPSELASIYKSLSMASPGQLTYVAGTTKATVVSEAERRKGSSRVKQRQSLLEGVLCHFIGRVMEAGDLPFHLLTETEKQCLRLVHQGYTSRDIAAERGVRSDSIDKVLRSARRKLGDFDRHELARRLVEAEALQAQRDHGANGGSGIAPAQSLGVQSPGLDHDREKDADEALEQPNESGSSGSPRGAVTRLLDLTDGEILRRLLLGSQGSPSNELDPWSRMTVICVIAACAACGAAALIPLLMVIERMAASL